MVWVYTTTFLADSHPTVHLTISVFLSLIESLSALILDVKVGKAAFANTKEKAQALAHTLVDACYGLGVKAVALITSMDAPLGKAVGNSVEVAEAISCLNGKGPEDLRELVCEEGNSTCFLNIYNSNLRQILNICFTC